MTIREDIEKLEEKTNKLEASFALEMLHDYKIQNRRLFTIILVVLALWFVTGMYLIYILNDIGVEEITTEESFDVTQDDGNNNFINGNDNNVNGTKN